MKEDLVILKVATKYLVHRYKCVHCHGEVKPTYEQSFIGDVAKSVSTLMHYYEGIPFGKIREILGWFGLEVSVGSLALWAKNLSEKFTDFRKKLKEKLQDAPHINADETGWPINGVNHWLWVFRSPPGSYFKIDRSRGSKVIEEVPGDSYDGVLITDFYAAYNKLNSKKQKCLFTFWGI